MEIVLIFDVWILLFITVQDSCELERCGSGLINSWIAKSMSPEVLTNMSDCVPDWLSKQYFLCSFSKVIPVNIAAAKAHSISAFWSFDFSDRNWSAIPACFVTESAPFLNIYICFLGGLFFCSFFVVPSCKKDKIYEAISVRRFASLNSLGIWFGKEEYKNDVNSSVFESNFLDNASATLLFLPLMCSK